jgi:NTE family protein
MKEIALALGGGGSKGNAHIGVLRVLDREGFTIRALAGTSAGGLWGSLYAYGYSPDEILRRFSQVDTQMLYQRDSMDGPSMMGVAGVRKLLVKALGECTFEELRLPFAVTAVDLDTAEQVVICTGKVVEAVMATIAVPGIFPAARLDGRTLVDGGILDPVPVSTARALAPGVAVVAVVLSPPVNEWSGVDKPRLLNTLPVLSHYLSRLRIAQALNIFLRSIDISGALLTELLLHYDQPDVIIRPAVPHIGLLDAVNVAEVAALGERAAELALPELEKALSWQRRLRRALAPRPRRPVHLPDTSDFPPEARPREEQIEKRKGALPDDT